MQRIVARRAGMSTLALACSSSSTFVPVLLPLLRRGAAKASVQEMPQDVAHEGVQGFQALWRAAQVGSEILREKEKDSEVELSTQEGKNLFREAMETGGMESYFTLAQHSVTQADPEVRVVPGFDAFCPSSYGLSGLASDPHPFLLR